MKNNYLLLIVSAISVLISSCQRDRSSFDIRSFSNIHVMSDGPQQSLPDKPCGAIRPTTVIRIVIPKDFLKHGFESQVKRRSFRDDTDVESGALANISPVDPNDPNYTGARTRIDFNIKSIFSAIPVKSIVAIKIINRSDLIRFDPSGPITVSADDPNLNTAPPSLVFCGAPILIKSLPDQDPGEGGTTREVVKFYIKNQPNPAKEYGYNIHFLLKDPGGDAKYDVKIVVDPKVTNYG